MQPKVFVVILNWNGYNDTVECIDSLKKITYPNYEILVVDNASSERDVELLKQRYGNSIHVIRNDKNYGYHKGFVTGMKFALDRSADYVLLIQNDLVVKPDFLDKLIEIAESHPEIGVLAPCIYRYDRPDEAEMAGRKYIWFGLRSVPLDENTSKEWLDCDGISDVCMLWGKDKISKTNLMEMVKPYFLHGDVIWCICAMKAKFKLAWVPKAKIWHKGSSTCRRVLNAIRLYWFMRDNLVYRYHFLCDKYYIGLSVNRIIYLILSFFIYQPLWHIRARVKNL